jgi:hypothetical protein
MPKITLANAYTLLDSVEIELPSIGGCRVVQLSAAEYSRVMDYGDLEEQDPDLYVCKIIGASLLDSEGEPIFDESVIPVLNKFLSPALMTEIMDKVHIINGFENGGKEEK